ncbi:MAG: DUF4839 domain-containing protein [Verrucomicrobia bacterium]|nr:DUF4839 domain-containing protein [Verrucomicrobiota bacterium]
MRKNPVSETEIKYSTSEARCVRGLEKRTIDKWEANGWEFVSEVKGKVQTTITFRKPKEKLQMKTLIIGTSLVVVIASIIAIGSLTEGDKKKSPGALPTNSSAIETPSEEPSEPTEAADVTLTIDNNADLAKLLVDTSGDNDMYQAFFDKYKGRTISFDGNVSYMAPHKDYEFTYDVLLAAGNFDENQMVGPPLRVENVVVPFGWKNTNEDEFITTGTNLKIVAELYDYNPLGQTFQVKLVSLTVR